MTIRNRALPNPPGGNFFSPRERRPPAPSWRPARRCKPGLPCRAPRSRKPRMRRASRARSRSRCASTARNMRLRIDPRTTLLDCLRETVGLTGTKKGCDHGQCGACTVHVNGRRVNSCLSLALMHDGEEITTIEGLGHARRLASDAGGVPRLRRVSVRILHVGPDHVGRRIAQGALRPRRCGREGADERQHLPLRRLSQHRGGDPTESARTPSQAQERSMHTFEFIRPPDAAAAVAAAAQVEDRPAGRAWGRPVHRRRDDAARPDEAERRDAGACSSTSTACRSTRSKRRPRAA